MSNYDIIMVTSPVLPSLDYRRIIESNHYWD